MNLYGLKNCDTCRKAKKALEAAGADYAFKDVREDGVTKDADHEMGKGRRLGEAAQQIVNNMARP